MEIGERRRCGVEICGGQESPLIRIVLLKRYGKIYRALWPAHCQYGGV